MDDVLEKTKVVPDIFKTKSFLAGYHYTSEKNWRRIQKEGMIPYLINKPELDKYFPDGIRGIWCWEKELGGKSEAGSILYQLSTKQSTKIVKLRLLYTADEVLHKGERKVKLFHSGAMNDWVYHIDEQGIILTEPIDITRIQLVKEFDVIKRLTE